MVVLWLALLLSSTAFAATYERTDEEPPLSKYEMVINTTKVLLGGQYSMLGQAVRIPKSAFAASPCQLVYLGNPDWATSTVHVDFGSSSSSDGTCTQQAYLAYIDNVHNANAVSGMTQAIRVAWASLLTLPRAEENEETPRPRRKQKEPQPPSSPPDGSPPPTQGGPTPSPSAAEPSPADSSSSPSGRRLLYEFMEPTERQPWGTKYDNIREMGAADVLFAKLGGSQFIPGPLSAISEPVMTSPNAMYQQWSTLPRDPRPYLEYVELARSGELDPTTTGLSNVVSGDHRIYTPLLDECEDIFRSNTFATPIASSASDSSGSYTYVVGSAPPQDSCFVTQQVVIIWNNCSAAATSATSARPAAQACSRAAASGETADRLNCLLESGLEEEVTNMGMDPAEDFIKVTVAYTPYDDCYPKVSMNTSQAMNFIINLGGILLFIFILLVLLPTFYRLFIGFPVRAIFYACKKLCCGRKNADLPMQTGLHSLKDTSYCFSCGQVPILSTLCYWRKQLVYTVCTVHNAEGQYRMLQVTVTSLVALLITVMAYPPSTRPRLNYYLPPLTYRLLKFSGDPLNTVWFFLQLLAYSLFLGFVGYMSMLCNYNTPRNRYYIAQCCLSVFWMAVLNALTLTQIINLLVFWKDLSSPWPWIPMTVFLLGNLLVADVLLIVTLVSSRDCNDERNHQEYLDLLAEIARREARNDAVRARRAAAAKTTKTTKSHRGSGGGGGGGGPFAAAGATVTMPEPDPDVDSSSDEALAHKAKAMAVPVFPEPRPSTLGAAPSALAATLAAESQSHGQGQVEDRGHGLGPSQGSLVSQGSRGIGRRRMPAVDSPVSLPPIVTASSARTAGPVAEAVEPPQSATQSSDSSGGGAAAATAAAASPRTGTMRASGTAPTGSVLSSLGSGVSGAGVPGSARRMASLYRPESTDVYSTDDEYGGRAGTGRGGSSIAGGKGFYDVTKGAAAAAAAAADTDAAAVTAVTGARTTSSSNNGSAKSSDSEDEPPVGKWQVTKDKLRPYVRLLSEDAAFKFPAWFIAALLVAAYVLIFTYAKAVVWAEKIEECIADPTECLNQNLNKYVLFTTRMVSRSQQSQVLALFNDVAASREQVQAAVDAALANNDTLLVANNNITKLFNTTALNVSAVNISAIKEAAVQNINDQLAPMLNISALIAEAFGPNVSAQLPQNVTEALTARLSAAVSDSVNRAADSLANQTTAAVSAAVPIALQAQNRVMLALNSSLGPMYNTINKAKGYMGKALVVQGELITWKEGLRQRFLPCSIAGFTLGLLLGLSSLLQTAISFRRFSRKVRLARLARRIFAAGSTRNVMLELSEAAMPLLADGGEATEAAEGDGDDDVDVGVRVTNPAVAQALSKQRKAAWQHEKVVALLEDEDSVVHRVQHESISLVVYFIGVLMSVAVIQLYVMGVCITIGLALVTHPWLWTWLLPRYYMWLVAIIIGVVLNKVFLIAYIGNAWLTNGDHIHRPAAWLAFLVIASATNLVIGLLLALFRIILLILTTIFVLGKLDVTIFTILPSLDLPHRTFLAGIHLQESQAHFDDPIHLPGPRGRAHRRWRKLQFVVRNLAADELRELLLSPGDEMKSDGKDGDTKMVQVVVPQEMTM